MKCICHHHKNDCDCTPNDFVKVTPSNWGIISALIASNAIVCVAILTYIVYRGWLK